MSKRLRSSFRPGKARSLRPRASMDPTRRIASESELAGAVLEALQPVESVEPAPEPVAMPEPAEVPIDLARTQPVLAEAAPQPVPVEVEVEVLSAPEPAPVEPVAELAPPEPTEEPAPAPEPAAAEPASTDLSPESIPTKKSKPVKPRALEDEDGSATSLSLSAQFFREDEDSVPPAIDSIEEDEPLRAPPPSPETIQRRARFRRVVGAVVAVAGLISVAVVGKTLAASRPASASMSVAAQPKPAPAPVAAAPVEQKAEPKVEKLAEPAPEAKAEPPAEAKQEPEAKPEPAAEAKAEAKPEPSAEAKADVPAGDAATLKKEALALMNRGKLRDAIPVAQAAISADPSDALPYLYLGSALQDTGKWKDGIEAYSECVRNATKGPVHECRAMGGKK